MSLQPPPRHVKEFSQQWKDWLFFLYNSVTGFTDTLGGLSKTKGNIPVADGTNWVTLGVGSNGQVLTADSAQTDGIKWAPSTGGLTTIAAASVGTSSSITQALSGSLERVVVSFHEVSVDTTANIRLQIGTSSSLTTSGYVTGTGTSATGHTAGWDFYTGASGASALATGIIRLEKIDSNVWVGSGVVLHEGNAVNQIAGRVSLAGALDIVGLVTSTGNFDGGHWKVAYQ